MPKKSKRIGRATDSKSENNKKDLKSILHNLHAKFSNPNSKAFVVDVKKEILPDLREALTKEKINISEDEAIKIVLYMQWESPLIAATRKGDLQAIQILCKTGFKDVYSATLPYAAIEYAVASNHKDILEHLLANEKFSQETLGNCLGRSVAQNNPALTDCLLASGQYTKEILASFLSGAINGKHDDKVKYLLSRAGFSPWSVLAIGREDLSLTTPGIQAEIAQYLIDRPALLRTFYSNTQIKEKKEHAGLLKLLLRNTNYFKDKEKIALFMWWCALRGLTEAIEVLLKTGASPDNLEVDAIGLSSEGDALRVHNLPLLGAAVNGHTATIRKLLEYKANINSASIPILLTDEEDSSITDFTALSSVAESKKSTMDEKHSDLILQPTASNKQKASVDKDKPITDFIALPSVAENKRNMMDKNITVLTLQSSASNRQQTSVDDENKAKNKNESKIEGLIEKAKAHTYKGDEVIKLEAGETALIAAASYGQLESVKVLLEAKADIHAITLMGHTALHMAAKVGRADIAEELIAAGADVFATNSAYQTPYDLALHGLEKSDTEEEQQQYLAIIRFFNKIFYQQYYERLLIRLNNSQANVSQEKIRKLSHIIAETFSLLEPQDSQQNNNIIIDAKKLVVHLNQLIPTHVLQLTLGLSNLKLLTQAALNRYTENATLNIYQLVWDYSEEGIAWSKKQQVEKIAEIKNNVESLITKIDGNIAAMDKLIAPYINQGVYKKWQPSISGAAQELVSLRKEYETLKEEKTSDKFLQLLNKIAALYQKTNDNEKLIQQNIDAQKLRDMKPKEPRKKVTHKREDLKESKETVTEKQKDNKDDKSDKEEKIEDKKQEPPKPKRIKPVSLPKPLYAPRSQYRYIETSNEDKKYEWPKTSDITPEETLLQQVLEKTNSGSPINIYGMAELVTVRNALFALFIRIMDFWKKHGNEPFFTKAEALEIRDTLCHPHRDKDGKPLFADIRGDWPANLRLTQRVVDAANMLDRILKRPPPDKTLGQKLVIIPTEVQEIKESLFSDLKNHKSRRINLGKDLNIYIRQHHDSLDELRYYRDIDSNLIDQTTKKLAEYFTCSVRIDRYTKTLIKDKKYRSSIQSDLAEFDCVKPFLDANSTEGNNFRHRQAPLQVDADTKDEKSSSSSVKPWQSSQGFLTPATASSTSLSAPSSDVTSIPLSTNPMALVPVSTVDVSTSGVGSIKLSNP